MKIFYVVSGTRVQTEGKILCWMMVLFQANENDLGRAGWRDRRQWVWGHNHHNSAWHCYQRLRPHCVWRLQRRRYAIMSDVYNTDSVANTVTELTVDWQVIDRSLRWLMRPKGGPQGFAGQQGGKAWHQPKLPIRHWLLQKINNRELPIKFQHVMCRTESGLCFI